MGFETTEHRVQTGRHTSFYLACGDTEGVPIIFCHGWPELSISWRHQLPAMAKLGYRAIAPDMRGYGRSSHYDAPADYAVAQSEADMMELLDHLGAEAAIWVGHDWGAPVVWSIAQHHPDRCLGVAGICVPYLPNSFILPDLVALVDRDLYPEDTYPVGQWDYWRFHRAEPVLCRQAFEASVRNTVHILFRAGTPEAVTQPSPTASTVATGGWFGPDGAAAPDFPLDPAVLTDADAAVFIEALESGGFGGPNSWYLNDELNKAHANRAPSPDIELPVLFVHAAYDMVCNTATGRLAEPMRQHCRRLSETTIDAGHWVAQEKPAALNAALANWIAAEIA